MCCHESSVSHERRACGCETHDHPSRSFAHHHFHPGADPFSTGFGVRRPLRFLAWKLDLEPRQVAELAAILNDLKTERAQAAVDDRRALGLLAEAAAGESFDAGKAEQATRLRNESGERVQRKVLESLSRIHALLETGQRERLAYLLRTGTLVM